jgi:hypothetical protein
MFGQIYKQIYLKAHINWTYKAKSSVALFFVSKLFLFRVTFDVYSAKIIILMC